MKKFLKAAFLFCCLTTSGMYAQVGMTSNNPNQNAALDLNKTDGTNTKGLLLPKVALTAINAFAPMTAHVAGMHVWNTATAGSGTNAVTPGEYFNDGGKWVRVSSSSDAWLQGGNNNGSIKFIGTNDAFDLPIETNGVEKMRVTSGGQLLINTTAPLTGGTNAKVQINNGSTAGALQITDGTQGSGKVLTSDGNGLATWQPNIGSQTSNFKTFSCNVSSTLTLNMAAQTSIPGLGPYTAPSTGKYELILHSFFYNPGPSELKSFYVAVIVNGVTYTDDETYSYTTTTAWLNVHYPVIISANAGDVITIKITAQSGAPLSILPATATRNRLDVIYLGL